VEDKSMKEISTIAQVMRDSLVTLKAKAKAATDAFQAEVGNSNANIDKVTSMTQELKTANKELEQMLGQSGSNFTPAGLEPTSNTPVDINGVWINPDAPKK
jgi:hypothetical protein